MYDPNRSVEKNEKYDFGVIIISMNYIFNFFDHLLNITNYIVLNNSHTCI